MKKTFHLILAAAALLLGGTAGAQHLGFHIGYAPENLPAYAFDRQTRTTQGEMQGIYAGATYTYDFSQYFGVTAGLNGRYSTRSYQFTYIMVTSQAEERQIVVDVPVLLHFGLPLSDYARVALFAGPLVSYAINGSSTFSNTILGEIGTSDWYTEPALFKKLNLQATFGLSLTAQHFRFFSGYAMGLLNIDPRPNTNTTTSVLYLGLGYTL